MGCSSSRVEKSEALRLCKERKRFIKEAIDSRYALTAAHLSYIQSLRSVGIALRRFAEAEVLIESSLSTSATDLEKTPSHSSYPSPSPSHNAENVDDSPLHNVSPHSPSPLHNVSSHSPSSLHNVSPHSTTMSYMKSNTSAAVTIRLDSTLSSFVDDEPITFPPPPPPPFETDSSWDYFDPSDEAQSFRFMPENGLAEKSDNVMGSRHFQGVEVDTPKEGAKENWEDAVEHSGETFVGSIRSGSKQRGTDISGSSAAPSKINDMPECITSGSAVTLAGNAALEQSRLTERTGSAKDLCAEREDPSEFITHRAKDFVSSIKDIEHRFFRASESGKEVSRMLEANKIRLRCSEVKGSSAASVVLAVFHLACCSGESVLPNEPPQQVTKVITWHRAASSQSSSSKNPFALASKDDVDDSGSDFVEDYCMITGSHSSTLDRLYAWERKLYDEVKASESVRKVYDQWCAQLRHQFARDASPKAIDKTRAVVKDLHTQIRVALHAVDSIAKRIEKLRDEELQPQLVELIQGLIRMWKAMLECHHAQYITISLAYHSKSSTTGQDHTESRRQVVAQLQHEIECFGSSFADWVAAHRSYIEALNGWLQTCIILPQERSRGRRIFSPRRALAPPIFVLCRDWSVGIKALPSEELIDAIKSFVADLHSSVGQQVVEETNSQELLASGNNGDTEREYEKSDNSSTLSSIHTSLTAVLNRLTKFAEGLRKMYEDIRQGNEAYAKGRTTRL